MTTMIAIHKIIYMGRIIISIVFGLILVLGIINNIEPGIIFFSFIALVIFAYPIICKHTVGEIKIKNLGGGWLEYSDNIRKPLFHLLEY